MFIAFHNPKKPTFYEKLIRWKTGGPIVHTEFVFDSVNNWHKTFSSVINVGTRFTTISFPNPDWELIELPKGPLDNEVYAYCQGMIPRSYDLLGILGFVLPWGEHDDYDVFCSESSTRIIQQFWDNKLFPLQKSWEVSPWKLFNLMGGKLA